jgi:hypothetical protein
MRSKTAKMITALCSPTNVPQYKKVGARRQDFYRDLS